MNSEHSVSRHCEGGEEEKKRKKKEKRKCSRVVAYGVLFGMGFVRFFLFIIFFS